MKLHEIRVYPSKTLLKREDQLAWKIAGVAADKVAVTRDVTAMIINRIIDNASVAIASVNRHPVVTARDAALGHPRTDGAHAFRSGRGVRVQPGMGGLGQWRGGARTRLSRHLPRRRIQPSGR